MCLRASLGSFLLLLAFPWSEQSSDPSQASYRPLNSCLLPSSQTSQHTCLPASHPPSRSLQPPFCKVLCLSSKLLFWFKALFHPRAVSLAFPRMVPPNLRTGDGEVFWLCVSQHTNIYLLMPYQLGGCFCARHFGVM